MTFYDVYNDITRLIQTSNDWLSWQDHYVKPGYHCHDWLGGGAESNDGTVVIGI